MSRAFLKAFVVALAIFLPVSVYASYSVASASGNPRARTADGQWITLSAGTTVPTNATIVTGPSDRVVLNASGNRVTVAPNSRVLASRAVRGGGSLAASSSRVMNQAQSGVNTRVGTVAGARAERSDQGATFRQFRRPGQLASSESTTPAGRLSDAQRLYQLGDFASARAIADSVEGGTADVQAGAKFLSAMASFTLFDYQAAANAFEMVLGMSASEETLEQAALMLGMAHYNSGDASGAVSALENFVEDYPESDQAPNARFTMALSLHELGNATAAQAELEDLIRNYPDSAVVGPAQEALTALAEQ